MKNLYFLSLIFCQLFLFNSCSEKQQPDTSQQEESFEINGETFNLMSPSFTITKFESSEISFPKGKNFINALVTIQGFNEDNTKSTFISFSLYFQPSHHISGEYEIYNGNEFNHNLENSDRLANGWSSMAGVNSIENSTVEITGNSPQGTVELNHISGNEYALKYIGMFKEIGGEGTFPVSIEIKAAARIETI